MKLETAKEGLDSKNQGLEIDTAPVTDVNIDRRKAYSSANATRPMRMLADEARDEQLNIQVAQNFGTTKNS